MNPNLEQAIIQFLANEFHVQPEDIIPDTDFYLDFNLNREQVADLIERMEDALNFILAEEKINDIKTVSDLITSLEPDIDEPD